MACYLIVGLCAGGRVAVGTTYLAELVPEEYENLVCTIINCGDSTIMIWQSIYYYFVPNWLYLHAYGVIAQVVMLVAVSIIPESPKFLYSHKKFSEARKKLEIIARRNKVKNPNEIKGIIFDSEITELDNKNDEHRETI